MLQPSARWILFDREPFQKFLCVRQAGIISSAEADALRDGLATIEAESSVQPANLTRSVQSEWEAGTFEEQQSDEEHHTLARRLIEAILVRTFTVPMSGV